MSFAEPALLFAALPLLWLAAQLPAHGSVRLLRAALALVAALALAGPRCERDADGATLLVLVDRSRSMPGSIEREAEEWIARAEGARGADDQLLVIEFGGEARIAHDSRVEGRFRGFQPFAAREESDLHRALELALAAAPRERAARCVVLSDGRVPAERARELTLAAAARGVAIDVRVLERASGDDVAVRELELPLEVERGARFSFGGWVHCERERELSWVLRRGGEELAREQRRFARGWTRLELRDHVERAGIARYELALEGALDARPENDRAQGAVRVIGPRGVLLLNEDGELGSFGEALRRADLAVLASRPEQADLSPAGLRAYSAVVIDDLPTEDFGARLEHLARFVREDGGGLLLGGGERSFGLGGYHLSALDALLPVSMELDEERRGFGLALLCLLDSSGSMSASVEGGRTKMELALEGAAAALRLLGPADAGGALLVDTEAEEALPLEPMREREAALRELEAASVGGGGIYVRTALAAAAERLRNLQGFRRHIVLFADASDAEEQDGAHALVQDLAARGVTLSVIALGGADDGDAEFLRECARLGGGGCWFTTRAEELPQLFAREALVASRAAYIAETTAVRARAELLQLGDLPLESFPAVPGYNRTFLRDDAVLGAETLLPEGAEEDAAAPILAWTWSEHGRTAAFTSALDGPSAAALVAWPGYRQLFGLLTSWLAYGGEEARASARVLRRGADVEIELELEEGAAAPESASPRALLREERGRRVSVELAAAGPRRWRSEFRLPSPGLWLGIVELGPRRFLELPPLAHSASSELDPPLEPLAGRLLLAELATLSGGRFEPLPERVFDLPRVERSTRDLTPWFLWSLLALLLLEIARRRLGPAAPPPPSNAGPPTEPRARPTPQPRFTAPSSAPQGAPQSALDAALRDARSRADRRLDRS